MAGSCKIGVLLVLVVYRWSVPQTAVHKSDRRLDGQTVPTLLLPSSLLSLGIYTPPSALLKPDSSSVHIRLSQADLSLSICFAFFLLRRSRFPGGSSGTKGRENQKKTEKKKNIPVFFPLKEYENGNPEGDTLQ